MKIASNSRTYNLASFENEQELEQAVVNFSEEIFGEKSVYFDIKKRVRRKKSSFASIPDGYVVDFREGCKLWVIENELSTHNSFSHIGIQLLKFASQFSNGSFEIKELLLAAINSSRQAEEKIYNLVKQSSFSDLGEALDHAIFKNEFGFVVVIDEATDDLFHVTQELARKPEIITLEKYVSGNDIVYRFDELLREFSEAKSSKVRDTTDIDTIVCPARAAGFKRAFLEQHAWWEIRISPSILPKLRYIAMYEVAPISAIRWAGKIESIKPYEDTGKYIVYCSEIFEIGPIKMDNHRLTPQASRYTRFELVESASKLSEIF